MVRGQKSWKHNFELTVDLKGPPSGPTFWLGFEDPDPYGYLWGQKIENGNQGPKPELFATNR